MSTVTIRDEYVRCGRKGCKSCPHGPYRYSYQKINGKLVKKYLGRPEKPVVDLVASQADLVEFEAECKSIQCDALIHCLSRRTFTDARRAYRRALRCAERDGDHAGCVELRRLWMEAWGARR